MLTNIFRIRFRLSILGKFKAVGFLKIMLEMGLKCLKFRTTTSRMIGSSDFYVC